MLFLVHKSFTFFEPIGFALDVDHGAVVQDAIQDGGGNGNVGKNLVPLGGNLVRGKYGRCFLVPSGNELTEQVCALDVHGEITDLINDKHSVLG